MDLLCIDDTKKKNINNVIFFFMVGIIAHAGIWIYRIASTDCNTAGLFYYTLDWEITLGRWFIPIVDKIRYYLSVPFLAGPIAVLLFAFATTLVLNILEINNTIYRYVVGGALMLTPCIGNTLMFYYCADSYALAMTLACTYVWLIKKKNSLLNYALATGSLVISLGLYQAYLGVAAVLCAAILLLWILDNEISEKQVLRKAIYMVVSAVNSLIIYYGITQAILKIKKLSLADYGGANNISGTSLLDIKIAVALAYQKFIHMFWGLSKSKYHTFYRGAIYSWGMFALLAIVLLLIVINNKVYLRPFRLFLLFTFVVVQPFLCGVIMLVVKGHNIHILMCQSYFLIIAIISAVILRLDEKTLNGKAIKAINATHRIFLLLVVLFGFELSAINNSTYEYNHFVRNNMTTTLNRVLAQAESMEGYTKDIEFAFAGQPLNGYPVESYLEKMAFLETDTLYDDRYRFNLAMIENMYREDIGCALKMCDEKTFSQLVLSDEFKNMPIYPENGSVRIVDNCVLVKFGSEVPMPDKEK